MIDRREFLGSATVAASLAASVRASARPVAADAPSVTAGLVDFALKSRFEDLPADVVHESRRYVLDALGCGVAGHLTAKGRLAAAHAAAMGGRGQGSRILGSAARSDPAHAAFANGELINALDYDAIPHVPPFLLPPLLAIAERERSSGRELIRAVAVGTEIALRLERGTSKMAASVAATGKTPAVFGICNASIVAAAVGCAMLLKLDAVRTANALGLAAYFCAVPSSHAWETRAPKSMVKYSPVGISCQNAVTAALLAASGYTGDPVALDGPAGFPLFFGGLQWDDAAVLAGLGERWAILGTQYKPHACCRFTHAEVDCLQAIVAEHAPKPDEIGRIHSLGIPFVANPDMTVVRTQEDAQFSTHYVLALAALGIPLDARCQDPALFTDPRIASLMARTVRDVHPEALAVKRSDPASYLARVEVSMKDGRSFVRETRYPRGTIKPGFTIPDAELIAKCRANLATALPGSRAARALDLLTTLDTATDIGAVMAQLTPRGS
ncbi:MmgE/PrpD family protein [Sphingomonas sp. G-3-2-10]|uniref:MmgE/PrpD family protein n=1 Tax=Sphingomonas sp. G-3-2-10 TaxID=2728838 RepID=UPI00146C0B9A|nr:MmgE/PrpD family protein [Sphingomonas sp. G-3-2-10]NML08156.1 MmgE/PrpD family protein [Sphingomonas sp. G-3-2-10]